MIVNVTALKISALNFINLILPNTKEKISPDAIDDFNTFFSSMD
jgi:hypothetical protein